MEKIRPLVRWATRRDFTDLADIDQRSLEVGQFTGQDFCDEQADISTVILVAESCGVSIGYLIFRFERSGCGSSRTGYLWLDRLVVDYCFRRQGVASALIADMVSKIDCRKYRSARAEVSEYNLAAQLLLKSCGFRCVKILRGSQVRSDIPDDYRMVFRPSESRNG